MSVDDDLYPTDIAITKDDFDDEACQKIIEDLKYAHYSFIFHSFLQASKAAQAESNKKQMKIYYLLAYACCFDLDYTTRSRPFRIKSLYPSLWSNSLLESFTREGLSFFIEILPLVTNTLLKARLADIVWVCPASKDIQYANLAIETYSKVPLDLDTWINDGRACWHRAIDLARTLGKTTQAQLQSMEDTIIEAINRSSIAKDSNIMFLSKFLYEIKLGINHAHDIATKLELSAQEFNANQEFFFSGERFRLASKWYVRSDNTIKATKMTFCEANSCVQDAEKNPRQLAKRHFYENAIQILRTIPNKERDALKVDERIAELYMLMNESGKLSLDEMHSFTSGPIDISPLLNRAEQLVSKKDMPIALLHFVNITTIKYDELVKSAKEQIQEHPLSSLIASSSHISNDGRTVAKVQSLSSIEELTDTQPKVHEAIMKNYDIHVNLTVQGSIFPSLEILYREHQICESIFSQIVALSPIIPKGREEFFSKGLTAGYDGDFVTAIHLLVPQVEHMVRCNLKNEGVKTTTLDQNGIETENGLSTLVENPEMKTIFGENFTFEIKSLLCDSLGGNLRNTLAHGLIDYEECQSTYAIYTWWLILKLVYNSFWNIRMNQRNAESEESIVKSYTDE